MARGHLLTNWPLFSPEYFTSNFSPPVALACLLHCKEQASMSWTFTKRDLFMNCSWHRDIQSLTGILPQSLSGQRRKSWVYS